MASTRFTVGIVVAASIVGTAPGSELLYDNFPGDSYNSAIYHSSEKSTLVQDSWTIDDASFGTDVYLEQIEWIGIRQTMFGTKPLSYTFAEYSVRTRTGTPNNYDFPLVSPAAIGQVNYTSEVLATLPNNMELYRGTLSLANVLTLAEATDYWVGVRLIGDASNQFLGRNFFVSAMTRIGVDEAYAYNVEAFFGWLPLSAFPAIAEETDVAFRLFGTPVPEPTSLTLVIGGVLAACAARRR